MAAQVPVDVMPTAERVPSKPTEATWGRCISLLSQASTDEGESVFSRTVSQETARRSDEASSEALASPRGSVDDGPALTQEGLALDLNGGLPIFFSHAEELSEGHQQKLLLKAEHQLCNAMELAHGLCEASARVDKGEVCSIDSAGVVRSAAALDPPLSGSSGSTRKKALFRKQHLRAPGMGGGDVLCADVRGKVSVHLYLDRETARPKCPSARAASPEPALAAKDPAEEATVLLVDPQGVVQGCRKLTAAPPVIPAC